MRQTMETKTSAAVPLAHGETYKQVLLLYLSSRTKITIRNQETALVWQNLNTL